MSIGAELMTVFQSLIVLAVSYGIWLVPKDENLWKNGRS